MSTALVAATAAVAVSLWCAGPLVAEPLTADACERLRAEKGALLQAGVQGNMSKGPEWAKVNLDKARLAEIERFLDVEDAIAFRCAKPLPPEVVKAIEEETAGPADAAQPPAAAPAPKAKQRPTPPRAAKAAPKTTTEDGQQAATGSDTGAAPAPPAPRPKVRRPPPAPKAAEPATGEQKAQ